MPCIILVVNEEGGVKRLQFHVGDTIYDFLHNIGSVALEHEGGGVKRLQFYAKYIFYTHCSTIEKCNRMEDLKKQVSKGYNSTSHMAGLQSEVELQCNLYKKDPTQLSPHHLF